MAAIIHGGGVDACARYRLRMLTAFAIFALLVVASVVALNTSAADSAWWQTPVALLSMAPALYGVYAVVSWFRAELEVGLVVMGALWLVGDQLARWRYR